MATDIAFAVGVLALLGRHVAPVFRVFLTAVAVVDDLIAVLVIAFFYTASLDVAALGVVAVACAILFALNRAGVRALAPVSPRRPRPLGRDGEIGRPRDDRGRPPRARSSRRREGTRRRSAGSSTRSTRGSRSASCRSSRSRTRASRCRRARSGAMLASPIALGIVLGLFFGKQVGIFGTTFVAREARGRDRPGGPARAAFPLGRRAPRRDRVHDVALRERSRVHAIAR